MPLRNNLSGVLAATQTAELGSFTAAARQLGLSPAAISKSVALLEAQMNIRLFNRTTRSLSLTAEGEAFVLKAREALAALDQAAQIAEQADGAPAGWVRISCAVGFGRRFVLPLLGRFGQRYPRIRVDLHLSDRQVDLVREGFDVGVRGGIDPPEGMVARRIAKLPGVLVASKDYLRQNGEPKSWRDLQRHALIGLRFHSGREPVWTFREGQERVTLEPVKSPGCSLVLSDPEVQLEAVLNHLGIAALSVHHAWAAIQAGSIKPVLLKSHQSPDLAMSLFYPHRARMAPRVAVLVEYLLAQYKQDPTLQADRAQLERYA